MHNMNLIEYRLILIHKHTAVRIYVICAMLQHDDLRFKGRRFSGCGKPSNDIETFIRSSFFYNSGRSKSCKIGRQKSSSYDIQMCKNMYTGGNHAK